MDSSQATLIKIARVAQELCTELLDAHARTLGGIHRLELSRTQFWLEKIVSSSKNVLEQLNQFSIAAIALDEQLEKWISANGPTICLLALNEMKRVLETRLTGGTLSFTNIFPGITNRTPPHEKINEAIIVFDNHRSYFDYLLTLTEWNHSPLHQTQVAAVAPMSFLFASSSTTFLGGKVRSNAENSFVDNRHSTYSAMRFPGLHKCADFGIMSVQAVQDTLHTGKTITERRKRGTGIFEVVQVDLYKLELALQHINGFTCFSKHVDILSQRQFGTCAWLPETIEFKSWLAGKEPFLWLQGKAGSGKSILTASLIDYLEKHYSGEPLAYFYCYFGNEETTNTFEVMYSLLYQLLNQFRHCKLDPGAVEIINELAEKKDNTIPKHVVQISSLLCRVARQFRRQPRIIIDGLDECRDVDRLLQALLRLETTSIQLLVSSRPIQAIKHRFDGLLSISLDTMAGAVSADIKLHIDSEVDSHQRLAFLDPSLKKEICSTLHQKADGMFRWVQCQLDTLKGCVTLQEFQETLGSLPAGLEATYERILIGIDQQRSGGDVTRRALTWLLTASRPLTLVEMTEALSIDIRKCTLNRGIAPIHDNALLDALGSLVVYSEETDLINLSHFSVKEYLLNRLVHPKLPAFRMNLRRAHKEVFQMCMLYFSTSLRILFANNGPPKDTEGVGATCDLIPSRPLLDYVLSCGFDHLVHLEPSDSAIVDSMVTLQSAIRERSPEWTHLCGLIAQYDLYKSWITPEHDFVVCVLISMFPEPFLRAVLNRDSPQTTYASNPLVHAVELNKVDHARTLLLRGIDANITGCRRDRERDRTSRVPPLMVALQLNNDILVDLLLKEGGAVIPQEAYSNVTEWLLNHSSHVIFSLLQADEFVEWATDFEVEGLFLNMLEEHPYAEHKLAEEDFVVIIRRLIQIGWDVSSQWGIRAVSSAVSNGHVALLRYLFSVHAPIPSGVLFTEKTASFVRDLESQGVDMNAITTKGDVTLHQVLAHDCSGTLHCWMLDCYECQRDRSRLLGILGWPAERTVIEMILILRKLTACLVLIVHDLCLDSHDIDKIRSLKNWIEGIRLALGELLRRMHFSFLENIVIEERFQCWLAENEPKSCLDILQEMWVLVERYDLSAGDKDWDDINKAIALFDQKQDQFRILFEIEIREEAEEQVDAVARRLAYISAPTSTSAMVWEELEDENSEYALPSGEELEEDLFSTIVGEQTSALISNELEEGQVIEQIPRISIFSGGDAIARPPSPDSATIEYYRAPPRMSRSVRMPFVQIPQMLNIAVVVIGQTGAGKSTLINMITGVPNHSHLAASVGRGGRGTTIHSASYSCVFTNGDKCRLWDTRGFDGSSMAPISGSIKLPWGHHVLLLLCVRASEIDFPVHWERFREMFANEDDMISHWVPVIVVTQMDPSVTEWEMMCRDRIWEICPRLGRHDVRDVALWRVRKHRGPSSTEYKEDAVSVREHISQLARVRPVHHNGTRPVRGANPVSALVSHTSSPDITIIPVSPSCSDTSL